MWDVFENNAQQFNEYIVLYWQPSCNDVVDGVTPLIKTPTDIVHCAWGVGAWDEVTPPDFTIKLVF